MTSFMLFLLLVFLVALLAGAVASVTGFGIGSLLTPLLNTQLDIKAAVAVVSIPHVIGTAVRLWILRRHVDSHLLMRFGLMSAAGGLTGAFFHSFVQGPLLSMLLGMLLLFAGGTGLTGSAQKMRFSGWKAWVAGAASGFLGGLVGNQGGIRSGAMLGLDVPKHAFVATATAVGLMVDGARVPVYLATQGRHILDAWPFVLTAVAGVVAGTLLGQKILQSIPEPVFRKVVSVVLIVIGTAMLFGALWSLRK